MDKEFTKLISANYNVIYGPINEYIPIMWQEDVQQDILLAAWQAYPTFKGDSKFSTWLYKISLYTCLQWRRSYRAAQRRIEKWSQIDHEKDDTSILNALLEYLKGKEVDILALSYAYGIKGEQIARRLGIKPNHVRILTFRAANKARAFIKQLDSK